MGKRVIAVVSGKGGVGKSTIAVNIATLLSMRGASTLLIDSDFYNPCLSFHLGLTPLSVGLQEILDNKAKIADALSIYSLTGLRCISSSLRFYRNVRSRNMPSLIDSLDYEFIIIDCSPGLPAFIEEVIGCSNELLIVMTPDVPSVMAALKMFSLLKSKENLEELHLVLNRVTNEQYELHPHEIENLCNNAYKTRTFKIGVSIPEDNNVPRSIALKTPVVISAPSCPAGRVLVKFGDGLLAKNPSGGRTEIKPVGMGLPPLKHDILSRLSEFFRRLLGQ
jgi:MinD-like ATPase involved in chromosome partitioning or flagellar assembly